MQNYQFHPLCEKYKLWSQKEQDRVVADMKANGFDQRYPIFLYGGMIVIGRNRYLAALVAEVEAKFVQLELRNGETLEEVVERDNENRRHQTAQELADLRKGRVERVAAAKSAGDSTRAIAEREGVSQTQVQQDLAKATEQGCSVEPPSGEVVGKDKKKRKAKKPKKLCEGCTKHGPAMDCIYCHELNGTKPKPSKNGREIMQWQTVHDHLGHALRDLSVVAARFFERKKAGGFVADPGFHGLERKIKEVMKEGKEWASGHERRLKKQEKAHASES